LRKVSTLFPLRVLHPEEVDGLVEALAERCRSLPVVLLYLHGAYAKGTQGVLSDLDLAVLLEPCKGRDRHVWVDVASALEEVCGRDDVDLVLLNTAGPIITDRVVRQGRLVYAASEKDRIVFEEAAIKKALDFRFFSKVYDDALFRQLREGRFLD